MIDAQKLLVTLWIDWNGSSFQIVKDPEYGKTSDPCSDQHNSDYDSCVYEKNHIQLASQLNCSFSYLVGNATTTDSKFSNGCKLSQLSNEDKKSFKTMITGKDTSKNIIQLNLGFKCRQGYK